MSTSPRVLVIEDDRKVLRGLERGLRDEGYDIVGTNDGEAGHRMATTQPFDCVVLDLMLPGRSGLEILLDLRRAGLRVPVLILTARDAVEDRVMGLDAGADDYLIKPFSFAELLARLRALLRRGQAERVTVLRAADLEVDLVDRRTWRADEEILLTQREFEVLVYLLRHKNAIVTREMLGREIWQEPNCSLTNVIEVYINLLRRKLEGDGRPPLIHTLRGQGYSLRG